MGELIELRRFRDRDRAAPDEAPHHPPYVLPFLWWRSAVALWSSLWLAPLGLRVEASETEPAPRQ